MRSRLSLKPRLILPSLTPAAIAPMPLAKSKAPPTPKGLAQAIAPQQNPVPCEPKEKKARKLGPDELVEPTAANADESSESNAVPASAVPAASLPASPRETAGTHSGQGLDIGAFGTLAPAPPVGDLPPADDQSRDSQALVKQIAASVLARLPGFMEAHKTIFTSQQTAPHLHGALPTSTSSGGMSSYKAPWDGVVAKDSLANSGLYQASANVIWLNPFPVNNAAQCIAGDVPTWSQVVEAANLFMSKSAAQDKVSLASPQGSHVTSVQRMLFPITVPAHCASPDVGAATGVLGNFTVVAGQIYVWAWYLGMHRALVSDDVELAASLWQMGLTTSVQLRHGLTEAQLATWSIQTSEQARHAEGVLCDTFPAFATKALTAMGLGAVAPQQGASSALATPQGAQAKPALDNMSAEKVRIKLGDLGVTFRSSKVNKTMATAVLMFRTSISQTALKYLHDIEATHGKDVLSMHYNKISRLVQLCTEASKYVGLSTQSLVEASLDTLHFSLRNDLVKPQEVTLNFLDNQRIPTKGEKADAEGKPQSGYVVRAIARFAFIQHLSLEKDDLAARASKQAATVIADLTTLCNDMSTYRQFESVFTASGSGDTQTHLEEYKRDKISTRLGKESVDLFYDVRSGEHDHKLALHVKKADGWQRCIDWRALDIPVWQEVVRNISLHGMVSTEPSATPRGSGERVLSRIMSTASEEDHEGHRLKEAERARIWAHATAQRKKWVNFVSPRTWSEKELDVAYQTTSAYTWDGKAGESHRAFIFSSDLLHDSEGPSWAKVPEWKDPLGSVACKFVHSKTGHADMLVFFDGRSRPCRIALEALAANVRNPTEIWLTYASTNRLGRRVAWSSDNKEPSDGSDMNSASSKHNTHLPSFFVATTIFTTYVRPGWSSNLCALAPPQGGQRWTLSNTPSLCCK